MNFGMTNASFDASRDARRQGDTEDVNPGGRGDTNEVLSAEGSKRPLEEPITEPSLSDGAAKPPSAPSGADLMYLRDRDEFFDAVEAETDLSMRAFLLRNSRFRPYDDRTRALVRSVKHEGLCGLIAQGLLIELPPERAPRPKPKSRPRKRSQRIRPEKPLVRILLEDIVSKT